MGLYRLLLHLYPRSFRNEYGDEMCHIFALRLGDSPGVVARALLWLQTIVELVGNAAAAHWDIFRSDLRHTRRTLARTPGFTVTAILIVALGVGATTAAFSVTDFVLFRPLPFPEPDRLVNLWEVKPGYDEMELAPANYRDWKSASRSFDSLGAYHYLDVNMVGKGEPVRLEGAAVSFDLFPTLGVRPILGRTFAPADDKNGAPRTVILSYRLWQNDFAGDRHIIGQHLDLDNASYIVIGVMPPDFLFPAGDTALWTTMRFGEENYQDRNDNWLYAVGRMRRGVTIDRVRSEWALLAARTAKQFGLNERSSATAYAIRDEVSWRTRMLLATLSGASACVLLIACANLANLLLARSLERRRELAVRTAMGAGRERLVRHLMTESLMIAVVGGALGVCIAIGAVPLLARLVPNNLPIAESPSVDARMLLLAAALTGLTGLIFGLAPVIGAGKDDRLDALRDDARAGGGRRERLRSGLVVFEVVASIVLLVSAGLLIRALWAVEATNPGFETDGRLTLRTQLPLPHYEKVDTRRAFYTRVLSEIRALPGVSQAAYVTALPMAMGGGIWPVSLTGNAVSREGDTAASLRYVTPGYFAAMGIPLKQGRDATETDTLDRQLVAVASESFVERFLNGRDPIGQSFNFVFKRRTIIGVVGNVKVRGLERISEPQVYLPYQQVEDGSMIGYIPKDIVVKASVPAEALVPPLRDIVRRADPKLPISDVRTMGEVVQLQTAPRTAQIRVLGAFAAIALLLAAIGIHGVLAFAVSQRTREIGVRMALGAKPGDVLGMIVKRGLWLALAGIVPGVAIAYAVGRAFEAILAGVQPYDGPTFVIAIGLAVVMTVAGTLVPTVRALRVNPSTALRAE
jgi:predicted permease